jgi:F-type H+-transporting ATPase subunit a
MAYEPQAPYAIRQFEIDVLIPIRVFGIDASFTTSAQAMITTVAVLTVYLLYAARDRALVPSRLQASAEWLYTLVADMVVKNAGPAAAVAIPFVFSLFAFILFGSLIGITPVKFTFTSHLIVTLGLSLVVFGYVVTVSIRRSGMGFLSHFRPAGTPGWLAPLIVAVEVISYLFRPVTLGVRVFANIFAGHVIIKLFGDMCAMIIDGLGMGGLAATIIPVALMVMFYAFEVAVFFIQAYIFALITSLYIKEAYHMGH